MVFEEVLEADDVGVAEGAMDLDFAHKLGFKAGLTFCLVRDFLSELLVMVLTALRSFVSRFVIS